jgi:hypothetical protein
LVTQFAYTSNTVPPFHQCIAISKNGDPTGAYYAYDFVTPGNEFPDYGKFGVWPDGYYMTSNQFTAPSGSFNGVGVFAFDRKKMLVGNPTAGFVYFSLNGNDFPEFPGSMQPSDHDGLRVPPTGAPNVFGYMISDEYESPPFNVDAIRLFNFHVDFVTPSNSSFTERPESPLPVTAYDARMPEFSGGTRREAEQPPPAVGTGDWLNVIGYRLMFHLQYMNRTVAGIPTESLVSSMTVNVSGVNPTSASTYQAAIRYFEFHKTTTNGKYSLYDNATFSSDPGNGATGTNRFLPSAAIDNQGNLGISYSISSTTIFPSILYAGRDFNAAGLPNAGLTGEQTLFAGTGSQVGAANGNRWGDYQSTVLDPTDDCTFWTNNEYYTTSGQFLWRTRIGSFKFATCTAPPQGTVSGTITACDSGAPISNALVELSNGFSAVTAADGTYSIKVEPGSYTVTASNPGRTCTTSSQSLVTVAAAGTATYSTCLNGTPQVTRDATDPTSVVVTTGNGTIDANECNKLNVKLTDPGCAPARNVSAVLFSNTPGVTVSQPNSTYPTIAIDGTQTNSLPFVVSTSAGFVCGTTINFTLTVTFQGGSSTVAFSLPTCNETQPPQVVNGSIDPADAKTVTGRLARANPPSSCGAAKACPGPSGAGTRSYDVLTFVNGPRAACVSINPTSPNAAALVSWVTLGAFDPSNFCTNYLGDQGAVLQPYSVDVPANGTINVVVAEISAGTPSTAYTVTVTGLSAPTPAGTGACSVGLTTQVSATTITLGQSTFDKATLSGTVGGNGTLTFKLFSDSACATTPLVISNQAANADGVYTSSPFTPASTGTYYWQASYSDGVNSVTTTCADPTETVTVNPVPVPTPTATATATATATPTATATATATASATATATATPTATPASQTLNLSTRMRTDTGNNVGIGGFTITGSVAKHVIIRALGPSLTKFGFTAAEVLADPTLEVHGPGSFGTITNNNWRDSQEAQIKADGLAPTNDLESAIDATLPPGAYTAIVSGNGSGVGICTFEVYDLDSSAASKLANLSTRAFVGTGNNVVIAGFVLGNNAGNDRVVVRGLGPSLSSFGIANTLADPTLELRDENGTLILANNDWQDNAAQAADITAAGLAPSNNKESAIAATLPPGLYTAILAGLNNGTGVGTVEVYDRGP